MSASESTMGHARGLLAVYGVAAGAMIWWLEGAGTAKVALVQAGTAVLWAGFVLAISWMEAWVKFRAPLLAKPAGLDAGRHVFRGLNAMEMPVALLLVCLALRGGTDWVQPCILAAELAMQVVWLTPQLERLAFFRIVELFDTSTASQEQLALIRELEVMIADLSLPPWWLHVVYVFVEGVKVAGLLYYAVALCSLQVLK